MCHETALSQAPLAAKEALLDSAAAWADEARVQLLECGAPRLRALGVCRSSQRPLLPALGAIWQFLTSMSYIDLCGGFGPAEMISEILTKSVTS